MKFKVGDRVIGNKGAYGDCCGVEGTITKIDETGRFRLYVEYDNGAKVCEGEHDVDLLTEGKSLKPKPVLYAVFYEEDDVDPLKEFYSRKELNDWLKEASEDRNIRWESIRVIEKPKFLKVEVSKSFRLRA